MTLAQASVWIGVCVAALYVGACGIMVYRKIKRDRVVKRVGDQAEES